MMATYAQDSALEVLEQYAYDLAAGRTTALANLAEIIASLRIGSTRGIWLLPILHKTAPQVAESAAARRQFFHATRAFVSLRRDPLDGAAALSRS